MLIVGIECAFFRDVNMYDSQVHSYEEHVGLLSEFVETHLSASFKTLCVVTIVLVTVDRISGWKLLKGCSWMHSMIGRASIMLAVLTSFTFLNVEMVEGLKPGWLKKRLPEVNALVEELAEKRRQDLRLALVREKVEAMTDADKRNIANLLEETDHRRDRLLFMNTLAEDEGDGIESVVVASRSDCHHSRRI